ncbi:protein SSUH2 homolog isoform X2 [Parasteatoda tepidariorum]|uniref:protein SSUH2 homolog isoform X2 n=1 Tax=Parasteatoda tepidariorum TaxID=114398 RepID=UPI001C726BE9|nr:protein SSUH2 homolog isoform X2 [Parasteatoda tepidariorum]
MRNKSGESCAVAPSAPPLDLCDDTEESQYNRDLQSAVFLSKLNSHIPNVNVTPPPDAVDDEPEPSAPPLELMDKVRGYETASFEDVTIPPPAEPDPQKLDSELQRCPLPNIPHFSEKEVRDALRKDISSHCCYSQRPVRDMCITDIKHSIAFHYTLETFTEIRTTCWAFEPYTGGTIAGSNSGSVPGPWEILAFPPTYFKNHSTQLEVPHTASLKTCHVCGGVGRKRCSTCSGKGSAYCFSCHGAGYRHITLTTGSETKDCLQCTGTGQRKCWKCSGEGMAMCKTCSGTGQIKCYLRVTIKWMNHLDDHVVEKVAALSGDRIRTASGDIVCQEEGNSLLPLTHFPDTTVNMASVQLLQKHESSFPSEKVLKQRHRVSIVPVSSVNYSWRRHEGLFYVYGYERRVYAPDYPHVCACCCCIM